ncbi:MAG: SDR family NAD(P)-dependent oxidoreductase [Aggregatilineales bacterium]
MTTDKKRVVFITGVSSGIGRATALTFAQDGYYVIGTARRIDRLESLTQEIATLTGADDKFLALAVDVTDRDAMQAAVQQTMQHFGRLDVLVANAGIGQRGSIADSEWDDIERLLRTNIDGVIHTLQAGIAALQLSGGGHIFTISSVMYNLPAPFAASYAASKAFVSSLAQSLRIELENENIRVTDVLVGRTYTEFNEKRLGAGKRTGGSLPTMQPKQVAEGILKATQHNQRRLILRPFDRLIVLGNKFVPMIMGQLAKRQYR